MKRKIKVCFFAMVKDKRLLSLMQWYKNDVAILEDLKYEVIIATKFREIPWDCDLYCSWWYTTSIFPLIKAKLQGRPLVILGGGSEVVASRADIRGYDSKSLFVKLIIRICIKLADYCLAVSSDELKDLKRLGARKSYVVYHAIDTDEYSPRIGTKTTEKLILTISHLNKENVERKSIWTILRAIPYVLAEFPDVKFVIIGRHMDAYPELKKFVKQAGIDANVKFPGLISQEEKIDYLHRATVYVQPGRNK